MLPQIVSYISVGTRVEAKTDQHVYPLPQTSRQGLCYIPSTFNFQGTMNMLTNFKIKSLLAVIIQNIDDIIMFYFTPCVGYID